MSGHSKWAQIKHAKASLDKKRGLAFSKLVRQITVAVREGGTDPEANFKLRLAVEKAREAEMPKDNIERAIGKAAGGGEGGQIEQITYEGYGPFGTAFLVEVATDNKNRSSSTIRHIFETHGGTLAQPGSVTWNFESRGQILIERGAEDLSDLELAAIDAGAEDVKISEEGLEVYTAPVDLQKIRQELEKIGAKISSCEIIMSPRTPIQLSDEQYPMIQRLYDELSEQEEVVALFTSANL
ncbi:MAG: hypothetical protein A2722_04325 [Candidatus Doudnabacteria bacterium RIFCSPHIGHO2_01_FULL_50_11]|uniref:Probable transcriptional regulatory protein A2722_04325 n=1 Tax=Candidatus Doudnabacteria bacterium RIFCSPHIGHO2_01_FULL_50_11 TaxID=1817828 RepID=A0A1F5PGM1_9BACT|nr:MAG: hypothetical protein A2722_04325 [Candidatus Doudnabacteria bacterium RIFCSPHIGHO2_01_FULL_50_11]HLC44796.1 YebC/PmpR family DNA-binding transcriptional regulator [Patescibacteria group bacterium]